MQNIKIRRYEPKDHEAVWELHKLGLAEVGVKPYRHNRWNSDFDNIEDVYLKNGDFIVVEIEGKIVAMGAFKRITEEVAELKRMRVHPNFQRKGFGQAIIQELEKRAKKLAYKKMILDTGEKMKKAQSFYKKNGYRETGRKVLTEDYHAIFYEKELI
ncbi:GNAT family N-acetyltransferase [Candidatus Daviesbacteria bacterium]|nr:GNAT family N-acetyltransferase [Candidatus Daviesbacteria bacterium]